MNKAKTKPAYNLSKRADIDDRLVWDIEVGGKPAGQVSLVMDDEFVEAPSVSCSVDNKYEGEGIEGSVLKDTLSYAYCNLPYEILHARHLTGNAADAKLLKSLGFDPDGKPYKDDDGLEWQNVSVTL